jgi:hypothetical protein
MLAFSHGARRDQDEATAAGVQRTYRGTSGQAVLRTRTETDPARSRIVIKGRAVTLSGRRRGVQVLVGVLCA